jgi:hypothetical protein
MATNAITLSTTMPANNPSPTAAIVIGLFNPAGVLTEALVT